MPAPLQQLTDKQTIIAMLRDACELEHMLCVQYLYAAFTLKRGGDPGITPAQAAMTQQWDQQLTRIAIQEMYHLMLANNLLIAIGANPYLWRPNFPQPATKYSEINIPSMLAPFDVDTASRFMCWEKPDQPGWWDAVCAECGRKAHARLGLAAAEEPPYNSIGQLYTIISDALTANPEWIDPVFADRQVTSSLVPFSPTAVPITTAGQAAEYIDVIIVEGEGAPDWESTAHFAYYHQIVDQLNGLGRSHPTAILAWPTVDNPVYDPDDLGDPGTSPITDPAVREVGELFNELYHVFVDLLVRLFSPNGETAAQRQTLADFLLALMPLSIKPLGTLLTRLPAGAEYPGRFAGPSFELPQPPPPPPMRANPRQAFAAFYTRMSAVTQRCRILSVTDTGIGAPAQTQLAEIAARLETLLPLLGADLRGVLR